ncbi:MAG: LexA family transcriptional regulator [Abditibacteriota bacterium]|nr:LexA family transcriptional regulator [Abditibacteriota bacterium]
MRQRNTGNLYNAKEEQERNIVGRAIAKARKQRKLSQDAFSAYLRQYGLTIKKAALSKWETGENVPSAYQLLALCYALDIENVRDYFTSNPAHLAPLDEQGLRKLRDYKEDLIASGRYRPVSVQDNGRIRCVDMPVSTLPVSAGTGQFLDEDSFEMIPFPESSIPVGAEFGIRVSGDSMEPVYQDGQIVWVRPCQSLHPGEVGVFLYDGSGYLKVYGEKDAPAGDGPTEDGVSPAKQPVLLSYNKKYEPILVLPEAVFRVAGKALN